MHPLLSAQLATTIIEERRRYAEERRRLPRRRVDRSPGLRLRAPWQASWSPRQPTLRSD
jgi:hypothetical protein